MTYLEQIQNSDLDQLIDLYDEHFDDMSENEQRVWFQALENMR